MPGSTRDRRSFPAVQLPAQDGGSPTEVTLIAQLGIGAGVQAMASVTPGDAMLEPAAPTR